MGWFLVSRFFFYSVKTAYIHLMQTILFHPNHSCLSLMQLCASFGGMLWVKYSLECPFVPKLSFPDWYLAMLLQYFDNMLFSYNILCFVRIISPSWCKFIPQHDAAASILLLKWCSQVCPASSYSNILIAKNINLNLFRPNVMSSEINFLLEYFCKS